MVYSDADGYPEFEMDMFHTIAYLNQFIQWDGPNAQDRMRTNHKMLAWSR